MAGRAARDAESTLAAEGGSVRFDNRDIAATATSMFIHASRDLALVTWRPGSVERKRKEVA